jgi:uncharacterized protein involved in exopolysaccharide biosynthesis
MLQMLKAGATDQNPEVIRQEAELRTLNEHLRELESSQSRKNVGDPLLPVSSLPQTGQEYIRRLRDLKYHESMFEFLTKQYSIARLDETKNTPLIQVVDRAQPPDDYTWPSLKELAVTGATCLTILCIAYILLQAKFRDPRRSQILMQLKREIVS